MKAFTEYIIGNYQKPTRDLTRVTKAPFISP